MTLWILLLIIAQSVLCLDNGVGHTPPMGWNSWNRFNCNINQTIVRQAAERLVSSGLAAKGYEYVNIDDCWQISRDPNSQEIIADKSKFPSGMANLSEFVHGKGLKFGLYSDSGYKTCAGRPGSLGYQQIDASTYAKWKVDYLKYDNCNNDETSTQPRYKRMRDALNATGRPIFFSMCQWGLEKVWEWASPVGNSWRTTFDIHNNFRSMLKLLDQQVGLSNYSGPGGWNDPDMLEVGNGLMTHDEYQSHFALWAGLKAPLLIGCNLESMTKSTLQILGNEEVIAINQDPLGKQIDLIFDDKDELHHRQLWAGPLSNDRLVLLCLNRGELPTKFLLDFDQILPSLKPISAREVISHSQVDIKGNKIESKQVRRHATVLFVVKYSLKELQEELQ